MAPVSRESTDVDASTDDYYDSRSRLSSKDSMCWHHDDELDDETLLIFRHGSVDLPTGIVPAYKSLFDKGIGDETLVFMPEKQESPVTNPCLPVLSSRQSHSISSNTSQRRPSLNIGDSTSITRSKDLNTNDVQTLDCNKIHLEESARHVDVKEAHAATDSGDEKWHAPQKTIRSMSDQMSAVIQHAQATESRLLNELSELRAEKESFLQEREGLYRHLEQCERNYEQVVQLNQHQRRTVVELTQKFKDQANELSEKQKTHNKLLQRLLDLRTDAERQLALANDTIEQMRREEQQAGQAIRLRLTTAENRSMTLEKQNELLREANTELREVCNQLLANAEADNE